MRIEKIVREHLDAVWRTARRLGVRDGDLEDVAQEVLVVVLRRLEDIEVDRERAFVIAATVRVTANWRRSRRRRPEDSSDSMEKAADGAGVFGGREDTAQEQSVERTRKLMLLETALREMTEAQRAAFTMFELEQLTAREIAIELGVPEAAVVSRVRRAREVFRRCCALATLQSQRSSPSGPGNKP